MKHTRSNLRLARIGIVAVILLGTIGRWDAARADQDSAALTASLDRNSVEVGETVWLTLQYRLAEGASVSKVPKIGGIKGLFVAKQIVEPGRIRIKILVDTLGSWRSDPITLSFTDKTGKAQTVTTEPVSLTVRSVLGDKPAEAGLKPIRDIIATKPLWRSYWLWGAALSGLLPILIWIYFRFRKGRRRSLPPETLEPPHDIARKDIEALDRRQMFEKGQVKAYYYTFSEIMRRYLASIRNFPAIEYTTEEISHRIQTETDRKLLTLLRRADLVKFSDTVPTQAGKEDDVRSALSYIDETRPLPHREPAVALKPKIAGRPS